MKSVHKLVRCLWLAGVACSVVSVYSGPAPAGAGDKEQKPEQAQKATGSAKPAMPEVVATMANVQIEIGLSLVSLDKKDLEDVARKSPGASVQGADVLALWRAGKGRLVTTLIGRTANSEQFTIKDIMEYRYPQAYEANQIQVKPSSNNVSDVVGPTNVPLMPADFQTREVGMIFTCTPSWDNDSKLIQLTMTPELSAKLDLEIPTYKFLAPNGTNTHFFTQPTIQNKTMSIKTACADGETLVYSSDILNQGDKEASYLLITPHLVRP